MIDKNEFRHLNTDDILPREEQSTWRDRLLHILMRMGLIE